MRYTSRFGHLFSAVVLFLSANDTLARARVPAQNKRHRTKRSRIVVLKFHGAGAMRARTALIRKLRTTHHVLARRRYLRHAKRLGLRGRSGDDIVRICSRLNCDAVIRGRVQRRSHKRYRLAVIVVDGRSGKRIGGRVISFRALTQARKNRRLAIAGRKLTSKTADLIDRFARLPLDSTPAAQVINPKSNRRPIIGVLGENTSPQDTLPQNTLPQDEPAKNIPQGPKLRTVTGTRASRIVPTHPSKGIRQRAPTRPKTNNERLILSAASGTMQRKLTLRTKEEEVSRYHGAPFPEFTLNAEVFPLVWLGHPIVRRLSLALSYSRQIALRTSRNFPPLTSRQCTFADHLDSTSQAMTADLKIRSQALVLPGWRPTAIALLGIGRRDFTLEQNDILPTFRYTYLRLGIQSTILLGTRWIRGEVGADLLYPIAVGQQAIDALGTRKTHSLSFAVSAGLRGFLPLGIFYFARVNYQRFSSEFDGLNPRTHALRPCFPDHQDQTTASDSYLKLWAGMGYALTD